MERRVHLKAVISWRTCVYFEGRGPSGLKLIEIIDEEDGVKGFHTLVEDMEVSPATPITPGPEGGSLPAEGCGTHGVHGAGEQQQQPQRWGRQAGVHGAQRAPRALPDGLPPERTPGSRAQRPPQGPAPGGAMAGLHNPRWSPDYAFLDKVAVVIDEDAVLPVLLHPA